jgi:hypothetical protein
MSMAVTPTTRKPATRKVKNEPKLLSFEEAAKITLTDVMAMFFPGATEAEYELKQEILMRMIHAADDLASDDGPSRAWSMAAAELALIAVSVEVGRRKS